MLGSRLPSVKCRPTLLELCTTRFAPPLSTSKKTRPVWHDQSPHPPNTSAFRWLPARDPVVPVAKLPTPGDGTLGASGVHRGRLPAGRRCAGAATGPPALPGGAAAGLLQPGSQAVAPHALRRVQADVIGDEQGGRVWCPRAGVSCVAWRVVVLSRGARGLVGLYLVRFTSPSVSFWWEISARSFLVVALSIFGRRYTAVVCGELDDMSGSSLCRRFKCGDLVVGPIFHLSKNDACSSLPRWYCCVHVSYDGRCD